jgi:hypothetical protein
MPMSPKGYAMKIWPQQLSPNRAFVAAFALLAVLLGGVAVIAQIEGPKRGVMPVASTGDFEISGILIEAMGKNADDARKNGWEEAQRKAWSALWARNHGGAGSSLSDSTLNGIVSAIVVEEEQIGPHRYIAKMGVVFDRARAGQLLGVRGITQRSAPLMILPVIWDGAAPIVFEQRNAWQDAWAKYNTSESRIDYVRPSGIGAESLLLNAGQLDRRSRNWWRTILDQFGAADVVIPIVRLDRQWPGGPVIGRFSARYGPDNKYLGSFILRTSSSTGVPAMLTQGVVKMDALFQNALAAGRLRADTSLIFEQALLDEEALDEPIPVRDTAGDQNASANSGNKQQRLDTVPLDVLDNAAQNPIGPIQIGPIVPVQPKPAVKPLSDEERKEQEKREKKERKESEKIEKKARKELEKREKEERKAREQAAKNGN